MSRTDSGPRSPFDGSIFEGPAFRKKRDVPDGLWMRCDHCEAMLYRKVVAENLQVCPECGRHFRMSGNDRIAHLADEGSFEELFAELMPADPLKFEWAGKNYVDYAQEYQTESGSSEAIRTGIAYIRGRRAALGVMDSTYIMGTLGSVVGERLTRLIELATAQSLPLVVVCASGGARMQEGALSLMQMAKTSAALARFAQAGGLYISVLTEPCLGGVSASYAMLGDVIIAEPGAEVGFTGKRVIANTIKTELPEGFQRPEFLQEHGFVDMIVPRGQLRNALAQLIDFCQT